MSNVTELLDALEEDVIQKAIDDRMRAIDALKILLKAAKAKNGTGPKKGSGGARVTAPSNRADSENVAVLTERVRDHLANGPASLNDMAKKFNVHPIAIGKACNRLGCQKFAEGMRSL